MGPLRGFCRDLPARNTLLRLPALKRSLSSRWPRRRPTHPAASAPGGQTPGLYCEGHAFPGRKGSWGRPLVKRPPAPLRGEGERTPPPSHLLRARVAPSVAASSCSAARQAGVAPTSDPETFLVQVQCPHSLRRTQVMSREPAGLLPTSACGDTGVSLSFLPSWPPA